MSIQEFSENLTSILQDLTTLREENAKLRETISTLENEKREVTRILSLSLGELTSSLNTGSSVTVKSRGKTILECFKKYVVVDPSDYAMIEEILRVKCCKVPTIIAGPIVAEAIIGKRAYNTTTNIFTFDEKSVVWVLLKYGFTNDGYNCYSSIKEGKNVYFRVHSLESTHPSFPTCIAHLKDTFGEFSWAYYDGNFFEHLNPKQLQVCASRILHSDGILPIAPCSFDSARATLTFSGDHLTMRSLKKLQK